MMRIIQAYIILALLNACSCRQDRLGYATINPDLAQYENDSTSFPFDRLPPSELCLRPVRTSKKGDLLTIENTANEGHSGIDVAITLNPKLRIMDAQFNRWNDMINGDKSEYKIEKIIFEVDKNPFLDSIIIGRYSLEIKEIVKTNKELRKLGINDTTLYSTFKGKFKTSRD
jgi:hypothetical protein